MAHWRGEYLAALAVRDRGEKVNVALYDAYTRLADRTATLATPTGINASASLDQQLSSLKNDRLSFSPTTTTSKKQPLAEKGSGPTEVLETTRADLAEAQRSRSELETRLNRVNAEVEKLRYKNNQDGRRLKALENDRVHLQLRLKDREEELRGKAKLLEDFQDEMATLNLQVNMAEDRSRKLQRENKELVDRWMVRMGQEADAMNDASKFS